MHDDLRTISNLTIPGSQQTGMGVILARAGVGKTAFLVQLAIYSMLRNNNVFHVSLNTPVKKVCLWYDEIYRKIVEKYQLDEHEKLWETALHHRLIMAYNKDNFNISRIEAQIKDLTEQGVFQPKTIVIDGFLSEDTAESTARENFTDLKEINQILGTNAWMTLKTHRHIEIQTLFTKIEDLFDTVYMLQPIEKNVHLKILKGAPKRSDLTLDPASMLISLS